MDWSSLVKFCEHDDNDTIKRSNIHSYIRFAGRAIPGFFTFLEVIDVHPIRREINLTDNEGLSETYMALSAITFEAAIQASGSSLPNMAIVSRWL